MATTEKANNDKSDQLEPENNQRIKQENITDTSGNVEDLVVYEQDTKPLTELEKKVREILSKQDYSLQSNASLDRSRGKLDSDITAFFKSQRLASVPLELYRSPQFLNKFAYLISEALVNHNAKDKKLLNAAEQAKLKQVAKSLRVSAYKAQDKHGYIDKFEYHQNERHNFLVINTRGQDTYQLALGENQQFQMYRDDHHAGGFSLRFEHGKFHTKALAEAIMLEAGYQPHGTLKNLKDNELTSVLDQLIEQGVDISGVQIKGDKAQNDILKNKQMEQAKFQEKVIRQINNEEIYKNQDVEKVTYPAYMVDSEAERRLKAEHLPQPVIEKFMQELVKEINNEIK
ncbi:hypothetical protein [Cysteiniphilum sp. 6C5]|uniref:hypothetical protein n=1 Tax=unclassified Cysteiniphilum TaxID=2610889 RepID=UPI003F85FD24